MNIFFNFLNVCLVLFLVWVGLLFQSTLLHEFFGIYKPALYLVMLSYLSLNRFSMEGGLLAYAMGYLIELHSGAPFGLYSVVLVLTFFVAKGISGGFYISTPWAKMLLVGGMTFVYKGIFLIISSIYGSVDTILKTLIISGILISFLNLLLTPVFFWVFKIMDEFTGKLRPFKTATQDPAIQLE